MSVYEIAVKVRNAKSQVGFAEAFANVRAFDEAFQAGFNREHVWFLWKNMDDAESAGIFNEVHKQMKEKGWDFNLERQEFPDDIVSAMKEYEARVE